MNTVLFVFGVLFAVSTGQKLNYHHLMEDPSIIACLSESNMKIGGLGGIKTEDDPTSDCFLACIFEKKGVLKDGVVDKDKVLAFLKTVVEGVSEEKLSELVDSCQPEDLTDKCAMAESMVECGQKAIEELSEKEMTA